MTVTVILCTHNRSQSLAKALESIAYSVVIPASIEWDVLVVDNNSSDETRSVVEDYAIRFPGRVRYCFEPQQGKSFALNTGVRAAKADVLAFVDDDVQVSREWLSNLVSFAGRDSWAGSAGRIRPEAGFVAPAWMDTQSRYGLAPLAIFDRGVDAGELREAPYGTNMAFRREMFSKHGLFRTDLGPLPGSDIRHNEDSEFGSRLLAAGERLWYEPSAVVYHAVPQKRVTRAYFLSWWYDKARADIRQDGIPGELKRNIAGVPIVLLGRLFRWCFEWMVSYNPATRFSAKLTVWRIAATIRECRRLNRQRSRAAAPPRIAETTS